ncbi:MAG: hypothetical protein R6V06_03440 [Kiritimatiellia bacterium]
MNVRYKYARTLIERLSCNMLFTSWIAGGVVFTSELLFVPVSYAGDLGFAAVLKGQEFAQTSADNVALGEWNAWYSTGEVQNEGEHEEPVFVFEAFGSGVQPGSLIAGSLTTPGGEVMSLAGGEDQEDTDLGLESGASSPLELNQVWPDGNYTFSFTGAADGALSPVTLSLTGGSYPPVPQVTNFVALQSADASTDTSVQWTPMGGSSDDFILLRIESCSGENEGETVYQSGLPGTPEALNGTVTETWIPAGVLEPGCDYQGEILFIHVADTETSSALYVAAYYKLTGFLIRTASLPGEPLGCEFLRANPADGTEWVSRDSVVAFHFSHSMNPAYISISWTENGGPLSTGTFSYYWTNSNSMLLCEFSSAFPVDSEIGWTLNLAEFKDAADFPLEGMPAGGFRTGIEEPETPPDIEMVSLLKTRFFVQTNSAAPISDGRYEAAVEIETMAVNRLKSSSVTSLADGRSSPLYPDPWSGDEYEAPGEYGSQTDFDRFYPNGDYKFAVDGIADGLQNIILSLGETNQYPAAPTITNLSGLQGIDPATSAKIQWNALPGWSSVPQTGAGFIELEINDQFGNEVLWIEGSDMISGTEYEIPPDTLRPGRVYEVRLFFVRITDWNENIYSGVMGAAGFESSTKFTITTGGQAEWPSIVNIERSGVSMQLAFSELYEGGWYALDVSSDLKRWTPLSGIWSGSSGFQDVDACYLKSRFYRLRECSCDEDLTPHISVHGTVWNDSGRTVAVAGALVSTGLDGQSTQTDAEGNFFLITDTPAQNGEASYTIEVISGAQQHVFGPYQWGDQPREQDFILE